MTTKLCENQQQKINEKRYLKQWKNQKQTDRNP